MGRLRAALQSQFADSDTKVHTPRNCEPLELSFTMERVVKVSPIVVVARTGSDATTILLRSSARWPPNRQRTRTPSRVCSSRKTSHIPSLTPRI